jgi:hypothetical protein
MDLNQEVRKSYEYLYLLAFDYYFNPNLNPRGLIIKSYKNLKNLHIDFNHLTVIILLGFIDLGRFAPLPNGRRSYEEFLKEREDLRTDRSKKAKNLPRDFKIPHRVVNVFCAGDDDQSIYGYQDQTINGYQEAKLKLMQRFRFDFPGSRVLKFSTSYRLPEALCMATQYFISSTSEGRIPKTLTSGHVPIPTIPNQDIGRNLGRERESGRDSGRVRNSGGDVKHLNLSHSYDQDSENSNPNFNIKNPANANLNFNKNVNPDSNNPDSNVNSEFDKTILTQRAAIEIRAMDEEDDEINWIVDYLHKKMSSFNNDQRDRYFDDFNTDNRLGLGLELWLT